MGTARLTIALVVFAAVALAPVPGGACYWWGA